jgi:hypothetical protein
MSEQEQKTAKSIIGTLVFIIAFMIFRDLSLPAFAVSYVNPTLSSGPFDLWVMAVSILGPIAAAYVFVSSKVGAGVVMLVASLVSRIQAPAGEPSTPGKYAVAEPTKQAILENRARIKALEAQVDKWLAEEAEAE